MPKYFAQISVSDQDQRTARSRAFESFSPALFVLLITTVGGCSPVSVPITYMPPANTLPARGASSAHVFVVGEDQRANKTSVGQYGQGISARPVVTTNDVADAARGAVEKEIQARGFVIGAGPTSSEVRVQILRFKSYPLTPGALFNNTVTAELIIHVQVERPGKVITYSQNFDVAGSSHPVFGTPPDSFGEALSAALKKGITRLFDDPAFNDALLPKPSKTSMNPQLHDVRS